MIAATLLWFLGSRKLNFFEDQGLASSSSVAMALGSVAVFVVEDALEIDAPEVAGSAGADALRSAWRRCDNQKPKAVAQRRAARITVMSGLSWRRARGGVLSTTPGMRGISGVILRCAGGVGGCCEVRGVNVIAASAGIHGDWPGTATTRANESGLQRSLARRRKAASRRHHPAG